VQSDIYVKQQALDLASQKLKHPRDQLSIQSGRLNSLRLRLHNTQLAILNQQSKRLENIKLRFQHVSPRSHLQQQQHSLHTLSLALNFALNRSLETRHITLERHKLALQAFSPLATLARGYAVVQNAQGDVIQQATQLSKNEDITVRLHKGHIQAEVKKAID
ncbi:MAG: exodeoxyribonuclease VII large subunit, partial [Arenicellales bacterium]